MKIKELILKVKEDSLSKEEVENYYDQMCFLYYQMQDEYAECEKAEAIFIMEHKTDKTESDIAIRRKWDVTEQGQKMFSLKRNLKGMDKVISALKSRIYRLIS